MINVMKTLIFLTALLALSSCSEIEESVRRRRSLYGHGFPHYGIGLEYFGHNFDLSHTGRLEDSLDFGNFDLEPLLRKEIVITKKYAIPVPQPYPVTVEKKVPVPVPHPVPYPVHKPYPVEVPKPYPVEVTKPVPVTVEKKVPYAIPVPVKVPYEVKIPYTAPESHPVEVPKQEPIYVPYAVSHSSLTDDTSHKSSEGQESSQQSEDQSGNEGNIQSPQQVHHSIQIQHPSPHSEPSYHNQAASESSENTANNNVQLLQPIHHQEMQQLQEPLQNLQHLQLPLPEQMPHQHYGVPLPEQMPRQQYGVPLPQIPFINPVIQLPVHSTLQAHGYGTMEDQSSDTMNIQMIMTAAPAAGNSPTPNVVKFGSGSLGAVHVGNGKYALGSGSLGYKVNEEQEASRLQSNQ